MILKIFWKLALTCTNWPWTPWILLHSSLPKKFAYRLPWLISIVSLSPVLFPLSHLLPQQNKPSCTFYFVLSRWTSPTIITLQQPLLVKGIIQFICPFSISCFCQAWWLNPQRAMSQSNPGDPQAQQSLEQGCQPSAGEQMCLVSSVERTPEECIIFRCLYFPCF